MAARGHHKAEPVDEYAEERLVAQRAARRCVNQVPGAEHPLVELVDPGLRLVVVKLRRTSADGKDWLGVGFNFKPTGELLPRCGEVPIRRVGILEYLGWLKGRPIKFLRNEAERLTGRVPAGDQPLALAAFLTSLWQLELARAEAGQAAEDRIAKLEERLARYGRFAEIEGLTEDEFIFNAAAHSEAALAALERAHAGDKDMADEVTQAELASKKDKDAGAADVKKMKAEAAAKKAAKPAEKKAEPKAEPKAEKKTAAKKAEKPAKKNGNGEERKRHKLSEFREGMSVRYLGHNEKFRGKTLKVAKVSKTSVLVQLGDALTPCSPNSFAIAK